MIHEWIGERKYLAILTAVQVVEWKLFCGSILCEKSPFTSDLEQSANTLPSPPPSASPLPYSAERPCVLYQGDILLYSLPDDLNIICLSPQFCFNRLNVTFRNIVEKVEQKGFWLMKEMNNKGCPLSDLKNHRYLLFFVGQEDQASTN